MTREQLKNLSYELSKNLNNVNITEADTLPGTEVIDNYYYLRNFLACKKIEGLTDNTLKAYKYSIKRALDEIGKDVRDIDANTIRLYLLDCSKSMQNVTVDNMRRNLNSFFLWLKTEGYIDDNPMDRIKKVKAEKKIKTALTTIEVQKVKDICKDPREVSLIDLLCSTGIRCEEVTKIKLSDINFETRAILIYGKGSKQRHVYMDDVCFLHVTKYLSERIKESEYLFCNRYGGKVSKEGMAYIVRELGKRAGIEDCQIHRFRKWFATTLFNRGCDLVYIQKLLGHAKLETTMIYVQASADRTKQEFSKFVA